ncbi:SpoVR family protein, partial [Candidatus Kaiserbacteria bacterium]|nr:SpoVR family protein [Candidatus Kaiserbacteria bacterium]
MSQSTSRLLYTGAEWDFDMLKRVDEACAEIAIGELGLDVYPNRFDVVGSDGMLDVYASSGVPKYYDHWSFGKHFIMQETIYRKGFSGLALEMVINSVPCISYLMEQNTATEQTTVIAHAAYGHNHFFKNNYLFKQWTDALGVLDYFDYAKAYIAQCEERYGTREVERLLDAAHALKSHGVFRHSGKRHTNLRQEAERARDRALQAERDYNDLWAHTIPAAPAKNVQVLSAQRRKDILKLPEENILYFLEKYAPRLQTWQREILRIVRNVAQYFYPQIQTQVMNEGCATYVHYRIMRRLHEKGQISDGNYQ